MKPWRRFALPLAWVLGCCGQAAAQDAPPLRVTAHLQAAAQLQVGGTARLELEVMTPTWFTQPPTLPTLELADVMVTPPSGQGAIVRDKRDGVAYSGLRYTYLLSPTAAGTVQVPALTVSAQTGPHGTLSTASSAPLSFRVAAGDGSGAPDVAAGRFAITQDFTLAPDPLVQGGRVTRSITQRADGVQAMLLPAAPLGDVPGFKRYPREPEITTLTDGRGGFLGGQRVDRADYVAQQAGTLGLPSVTLHWRDSDSGQPQQQELPGRAFTVQAATSSAPPFSLAEDLAQLRHGWRWMIPAGVLTWVAGAMCALLAGWLGWPWWRRGGRALRAWVARARIRRRAGEPWHWRAWLREARQNAAVLSAFYRWLAVCSGARDLRTAVATLDATAGAAAALALSRAYGPQAGEAAWRTRLAAATRQWRRIWRARSVATPAHALPASLNPYGNPIHVPRARRRGSE